MVAISIVFATAAAPFDRPWNVFGLELGKPVSLPNCNYKTLPGGTVSKYTFENDPINACHEPDIQLSDAPWRRGYVNFPVAKTPLILPINGGFTLVVDGKLEGLRFSTLSYANTDAIMRELTTKFGRPTSVTNTVSTVSGIAVPARWAEWKLPDLYVSYRNIDTDMKYGFLEIETPVMRALRLAHEQQQEKQRQAL
jgi:hypothetical protein